MPAPTHPTAFVASVPPDTTATPPAAPAPRRGARQPLGLWPMLLALLSAFALSQSYRTVTAIIATGMTNVHSTSEQVTLQDMVDLTRLLVALLTEPSC